MTGYVVVGTDTDAGKTAFSAAFLAANIDRFAYWKPVETGDSDTATIRRLVPGATVFDPLAHFDEPVAPMLAAKRAGRPMPTVAEILAAVPALGGTGFQPVPGGTGFQPVLSLLIETFGGPLSPLTDNVLQLELIRAFRLPIILVSSSAVGAVGRTLAAARALEEVELAGVALMGPEDPFAVEQLNRHLPSVPVMTAPLPTDWMPESVAACVIRGEPRAPLRGLRVAANHVWHPYTPLRGADDPLPVVSADREFLTLEDGRRIIDGSSSWWTILHGHREPAVMQAIRDATRRLDHVLFAGATHPDAERLAAHLLAAMPWPVGGRVFYSDNGSTAVEVALKMAYQFHCHREEPHRTLFIGFEGGYHGDTFGAMSVGRDPLFFGRFEPLLFRALQVPVDANTLDEALAKHDRETAAVIIEPLVQGAGGMRMHTPRDLADIAEVCQRRGVLFIADEVMTGFGRTGSLWAFDQAGVAPDLVCLAKGITGGVLPLAATLAAPHVVQAFDTPDRTRTFFHGHSFTANPIACAAAVASWNRLSQDEWKRDVTRIEAFWQEHLAALTTQPAVKEVRIRGVIAAIELDLPGGYLAEAVPAMRRAALDAGVLLRPLGNVIYAMPPFCTSNDSLEQIAVAMERAVAVATHASGAI